MSMSSSLDPSILAKIEAAKQGLVDREKNPLLDSLPDKFDSFRHHQVKAIENIMVAFQDYSVVVLDAPTGSGKTLIGETVRRLLKERAVYACSSKSLQDQFAGDFPYAKVVKGRGNYATERFPNRYKPNESWKDSHLSCEDCDWTKDTSKCSWCHGKRSCPYEIAKRDGLIANVAVLNTSYWLTEVNGPHKFSCNHGLVIFDEADTLESNLMGFVSVEISARRMEKYGWNPPKKVTVASSWLEWCEEMVKNIKREYDKIPDVTSDIRVAREGRYLYGLIDKLEAVKKGLTDENSSWVYTGKDKHVSFKPVRVDGIGQQFVWKHAEKFLLMSATVISADEMMDSLGYEGEYAVVRMPNTFPVKNRKVVVKPVADMSRAGGEEGRTKLIKEVRRILDEYGDSRVLVHSVSYDLTRAIVAGLEGGEGVDRPVFSYNTAGERDNALTLYSRNERAVLVAPSMERGIDLPGDLCRVQIIAKCPFPYLGDRQVSQRLYGTRGGQVWYSVQTIRALVQMSGRAIRSETDWAVTFILDTQFRDQLWSRGGRGLFPRWFVEALVW